MAQRVDRGLVGPECPDIPNGELIDDNDSSIHTRHLSEDESVVVTNQHTENPSDPLRVNKRPKRYSYFGSVRSYGGGFGMPEPTRRIIERQRLELGWPMLPKVLQYSQEYFLSAHTRPEFWRPQPHIPYLGTVQNHQHSSSCSHHVERVVVYLPYETFAGPLHSRPFSSQLDITRTTQSKHILDFMHPRVFQRIHDQVTNTDQDCSWHLRFMALFFETLMYSHAFLQLESKDIEQILSVYPPVSPFLIYQALVRWSRTRILLRTTTHRPIRVSRADAERIIRQELEKAHQPCSCKVAAPPPCYRDPFSIRQELSIKTIKVTRNLLAYIPLSACELRELLFIFNPAVTLFSVGERNLIYEYRFNHALGTAACRTEYIPSVSLPHTISPAWRAQWLPTTLCALQYRCRYSRAFLYFPEWLLLPRCRRFGFLDPSGMTQPGASNSLERAILALSTPHACRNLVQFLWRRICQFRSREPSRSLLQPGDTVVAPFMISIHDVVKALHQAKSTIRDVRRVHRPESWQVKNDQLTAALNQTIKSLSRLVEDGPFATLPGKKGMLSQLYSILSTLPPDGRILRQLFTVRDHTSGAGLLTPLERSILGRLCNVPKHTGDFVREVTFVPRKFHWQQHVTDQQALWADYLNSAKLPVLRQSESMTKALTATAQMKREVIASSSDLWLEGTGSSPTVAYQDSDTDAIQAWDLDEAEELELNSDEEAEESINNLRNERYFTFGSGGSRFPWLHKEVLRQAQLTHDLVMSNTHDNSSRPVLGRIWRMLPHDPDDGLNSWRLIDKVRNFTQRSAPHKPRTLVELSKEEALWLRSQADKAIGSMTKPTFDTSYAPALPSGSVLEILTLDSLENAAKAVASKESESRLSLNRYSIRAFISYSGSSRSSKLGDGGATTRTTPSQLDLPHKILAFSPRMRQWMTYALMILDMFDAHNSTFFAPAKLSWAIQSVVTSTEASKHAPAPLPDEWNQFLQDRFADKVIQEQKLRALKSSQMDLVNRVLNLDLLRRMQKMEEAEKDANQRAKTFRSIVEEHSRMRQRVIFGMEGLPQVWFSRLAQLEANFTLSVKALPQQSNRIPRRAQAAYEFTPSHDSLDVRVSYIQPVDGAAVMVAAGSISPNAHQFTLLDVLYHLNVTSSEGKPRPRRFTTSTAGATMTFTDNNDRDLAHFLHTLKQAIEADAEVPLDKTQVADNVLIEMAKSYERLYCGITHASVLGGTEARDARAKAQTLLSIFVYSMMLSDSSASTLLVRIGAGLGVLWLLICVTFSISIRSASPFRLNTRSHQSEHKPSRSNRVDIPPVAPELVHPTAVPEYELASRFLMFSPDYDFPSREASTICKVLSDDHHLELPRIPQATRGFDESTLLTEADVIPAPARWNTLYASLMGYAYGASDQTVKDVVSENVVRDIKLRALNIRIPTPALRSFLGTLLAFGCIFLIMIPDSNIKFTAGYVRATGLYADALHAQAYGRWSATVRCRAPTNHAVLQNVFDPSQGFDPDFNHPFSIAMPGGYTKLWFNRSTLLNETYGKTSSNPNTPSPLVCTQALEALQPTPITLLEIAGRPPADPLSSATPSRPDDEMKEMCWKPPSSIVMASVIYENLRSEYQIQLLDLLHAHRSTPLNKVAQHGMPNVINPTVWFPANLNAIDPFLYAFAKYCALSAYALVFSECKSSALGESTSLLTQGVLLHRNSMERIFATHRPRRRPKSSIFAIFSLSMDGLEDQAVLDGLLDLYALQGDPVPAPWLEGDNYGALAAGWGSLGLDGALWSIRVFGTSDTQNALKTARDIGVLGLAMYPSLVPSFGAVLHEKYTPQTFRTSRIAAVTRQIQKRLTKVEETLQKLCTIMRKSQYLESRRMTNHHIRGWKMQSIRCSPTFRELQNWSFKYLGSQTFARNQLACTQALQLPCPRIGRSIPFPLSAPSTRAEALISELRGHDEWFSQLAPTAASEYEELKLHKLRAYLIRNFTLPATQAVRVELLAKTYVRSYFGLSAYLAELGANSTGGWFDEARETLLSQEMNDHMYISQPPLNYLTNQPYWKLLSYVSAGIRVVSGYWKHVIFSSMHILNGNHTLIGVVAQKASRHHVYPDDILPSSSLVSDEPFSFQEARILPIDSLPDSHDSQVGRTVRWSDLDTLRFRTGSRQSWLVSRWKTTVEALSWALPELWLNPLSQLRYVDAPAALLRALERSDHSLSTMLLRPVMERLMLSPPRKIHFSTSTSHSGGEVRASASSLPSKSFWQRLVVTIPRMCIQLPFAILALAEWIVWIAAALVALLLEVVFKVIVWFSWRVVFGALDYGSRFLSTVTWHSGVYVLSRIVVPLRLLGLSDLAHFIQYDLLVDHDKPTHYTLLCCLLLSTAYLGVKKEVTQGPTVKNRYVVSSHFIWLCLFICWRHIFQLTHWVCSEFAPVWLFIRKLFVFPKVPSMASGLFQWLIYIVWGQVSDPPGTVEDPTAVWAFMSDQLDHSALLLTCVFTLALWVRHTDLNIADFTEGGVMYEIYSFATFCAWMLTFLDVLNPLGPVQLTILSYRAFSARGRYVIPLCIYGLCYGVLSSLGVLFENIVRFTVLESLFILAIMATIIDERKTLFHLVHALAVSFPRLIPVFDAVWPSALRHPVSFSMSLDTFSKPGDMPRNKYIQALSLVNPASLPRDAMERGDLMSPSPLAIVDEHRPIVLGEW